MCKAGYLRAEIKDAHGQTNIVCLQGFCGFYGRGSGCIRPTAIESCDKSTFINYGKISTESCLRCSPGFYLAIDYDLS